MRRHRAARAAPDRLEPIAGAAAIAALFRLAPERVERLLFLPERIEALEAACRAMARAHKPFRHAPAEELSRLAGTPMHGGAVALARPRPIAAFDPVLAARDAPPLLLILDGVANPHNLGAIARSAAFFGLDRLVLSDHPAQAQPSAAAYRVAEGGLEALALARVKRLPFALKRLAEGGVLTLAASAHGGGPIPAPRSGRPVALVLGNEERGPSEAALAACAARVTLRGKGAVESLNVAAAAAILLHALAVSR
ncbi:MAG: RNA methyltransferase [Alphaproteobacteria bacterium]|nr:RNA methyltransferase [Alphaproteobacteria bacterium]